jgi:hypothetical protein
MQASQGSPPESGGETREARRGGSVTTILKDTFSEPPRLRLQRWPSQPFVGGAATPPNLGGDLGFTASANWRIFRDRH